MAEKVYEVLATLAPYDCDELKLAVCPSGRNCGRCVPGANSFIKLGPELNNKVTWEVVKIFENGLGLRIKGQTEFVKHLINGVRTDKSIKI